jgi:hypothetical protein
MPGGCQWMLSDFAMPPERGAQVAKLEGHPSWTRVRIVGTGRDKTGRGRAEGGREGRERTTRGSRDHEHNNTRIKLGHSSSKQHQHQHQHHNQHPAPAAPPNPPPPPLFHTIVSLRPRNPQSLPRHSCQAANLNPRLVWISTPYFARCSRLLQLHWPRSCRSCS